MPTDIFSVTHEKKAKRSSCRNAGALSEAILGPTDRKQPCAWLVTVSSISRLPASARRHIAQQPVKGGIRILKHLRRDLILQGEQGFFGGVGIFAEIA